MEALPEPVRAEVLYGMRPAWEAEAVQLSREDLQKALAADGAERGMQLRTMSEAAGLDWERYLRTLAVLNGNATRNADGRHAFYRVLTAANHSCRPNAAWVTVEPATGTKELRCLVPRLGRYKAYRCRSGRFLRQAADQVRAPARDVCCDRAERFFLLSFGYARMAERKLYLKSVLRKELMALGSCGKKTSPNCFFQVITNPMQHRLFSLPHFRNHPL